MRQLFHTPEGVRDIYGSECEKKLHLQGKLQTVFHSFGYQDIETPTFEFFDVFSAQVGTTPSRALYKFFDREGNTLVLRPDFTPSIARAASQYFSQENFPVRLCYRGNTFVNNSSYQGRLKEPTKMGAELLGDATADADAEIIALMVELLKTTGLTEFQISIGEVEFFKALVEETGMDEETVARLRQMISSKNHFGVEELLLEQKLSEEQMQALSQLPQLFGSQEVLEKARSLTSNEKALKALGRLEDIYQVLEFYGCQQYVSFDLGMLSKYQYYTGIIFQGYTYGTGEPLVKGGRYDSLLAHFGRPAPAIGFELVMDQVMSALERQQIPAPVTKGRTLILYKEDTRPLAIGLAREHREHQMDVQCMLMEEGRTLEDYKSYGRKNHFGGIVYPVNEDEIRVINLFTDEVQTARIQDLR